MNELDIILNGLQDYGYDYIDYQENSTWIVVQVDANKNEVVDVIDVVDTVLFDATDRFYEVSGEYVNGKGVEIEVYIG